MPLGSERRGERGDGMDVREAREKRVLQGIVFDVDGTLW